MRSHAFLWVRVEIWGYAGLVVPTEKIKYKIQKLSKSQAFGIWKHSDFKTGQASLNTYAYISICLPAYSIDDHASDQDKTITTLAAPKC